MKRCKLDQFPKLLHHILSSATEDYLGLYEVVWEINARYPETEVRQRHPAAKWVVESLLSRGWVELYECRDYIKAVSEFEKVPPEKWSNVLETTANWEPHWEGLSYWIASSPEGDRVYFGRA